MSFYPEHDKLVEVAEESQSIGDFLGWLESQGINLYKDDDIGGPYPCFESREHLLAGYFQIDLGVLEKEKREIIKSLR